MAKTKTKPAAPVERAAKTTKLAVEVWPVDRPKPYGRNPRVISESAVEKVAASIQRYGWRQPIVVNGSGVILAGHTRLMAARSMRLASVPVHVARGLTPQEESAYRLADNRVADESEWDMDKLAIELRDLPGDLPLGFDADELARILADELPPEDDAELPEVGSDADAVSKRGEIYALGPHRLMCGDATSPEDWHSLMGNEEADVCFTSPPYGAAKVAKLRDHYERGKSKRGSFYQDHDDDPGQWLDLMRRWYGCVAPRVELVICNVQMLADNKRSMIEWLHDHRASLIDVAVWDKVNAAPQMAANVMSNAFEFMFLLGGNGSRSVPFADFHGTIKNVVRIDPRTEQNENAETHRAVMPTALALWALRDLCPKAKTVVEPFAGTGTTIIAAAQTMRVCRAMELSPAYCDVIRRRWGRYASANQLDAGAGALDG